MKIRSYFIYYTLILFLISVVSIIFSSIGLAAETDTLTLQMNGKEFPDLPYIIEDGEVLTPARTIVEELGGKIEWYGELKVLQTKFDDGHEIKLQIDSPIIQINPGSSVQRLAVPPRIVNNQTMVPLKYFARHFGYQYKWNAEERVATVYKPYNWVLDMTFDDGLDGEKLIINSTKKVPYTTHVLSEPDRLVLDIEKSSLSARASDILWESYVFKSVRIAQNELEVVRVVIELNNQVQYKIIDQQDQEGYKLIVAFSPGVRNVELTEQGLSIKSSGEIGEYSLLNLIEPHRLVIDVKGQTLQLAEKTKAIKDHPLIKQIRASQLSWEPEIVRLVLDLKKEIDYNVLRGKTAKEIIVKTRGIDELRETIEIVQNNQNQTGGEEPSGDSDTDTTTTNTGDDVVDIAAEFVLVDVGQEYSDNELIQIGISEGVNQRVFIKTSTPMDYIAWYLPNPDRLVVDLKGARTQLTMEDIPAGKGTIKKVRMHQHPDKVRVVFDLSEYVSHSILSEARTQKIEIGLGQNPLRGKVIVIDPGHGGYDPGAVGKNQFYEKEVTLDIGIKLRNLLRDTGATVIMTRDRDVYPSLGERVDLANQLNADIFISVHCNSAKNVDPGGTETFISSESRPGNEELATALHTNVVKSLGLFDRGLKADRYYVLSNTTMPAALVEVAFISKDDEAALLKTAEIRQKAANGLYKGILAYFTQLLESGESQ